VEMPWKAGACHVASRSPQTTTRSPSMDAHRKPPPLGCRDDMAALVGESPYPSLALFPPSRTQKFAVGCLTK
jgi:hypothetical protein